MLRLLKFVRIALALPFFLIAWLLLGGLVLSGCARPPVTIPIAESLRQPCKGPPIPNDPVTVSDLAAFSVEQEGALQACEAKRSALVQTVDAAQPKR